MAAPIFDLRPLQEENNRLKIETRKLRQNVQDNERSMINHVQMMDTNIITLYKTIKTDHRYIIIGTPFAITLAPQHKSNPINDAILQNTENELNNEDEDILSKMDVYFVGFGTPTTEKPTRYTRGDAISNYRLHGSVNARVKNIKLVPKLIFRIFRDGIAIDLFYDAEDIIAIYEDNPVVEQALATVRRSTNPDIMTHVRSMLEPVRQPNTTINTPLFNMRHATVSRGKFAKQSLLSSFEEPPKVGGGTRRKHRKFGMGGGAYTSGH